MAADSVSCNVWLTDPANSLLQLEKQPNPTPQTILSLWSNAAYNFLTH